MDVILFLGHEPEYQAQWKFESISGQGFRLKVK